MTDFTSLEGHKRGQTVHQDIGTNVAVFDYNRRNEHIDEASLLNRGYDFYGTPYAPCSR